MQQSESSQPSVIVVGGGLAGLAAAHTVLRSDGHVILVEKEKKLGGNSMKASSGINGAESFVQQKLEVCLRRPYVGWGRLRGLWGWGMSGCSAHVWRARLCYIPLLTHATYLCQVGELGKLGKDHWIMTDNRWKWEKPTRTTGRDTHFPRSHFFPAVADLFIRSLKTGHGILDGKNGEIESICGYPPMRVPGWLLPGTAVR